MGAFGNMIRRVAATSYGSNLSDKIHADGSIREEPPIKQNKINERKTSITNKIINNRSGIKS